MTGKKQDKTRNQRQAKRREREKEWLISNGWSSWEALHTALLRDAITLERPAMIEQGLTGNDQNLLSPASPTT